MVLGGKKILQFLEAQISPNKDILDRDKELVRKFEKEDLPTLSFSSDIKSSKFEENKDNLLHELSFKNHYMVNALPEYENFDFIEDYGKNKF